MAISSSSASDLNMTDMSDIDFDDNSDSLPDDVPGDVDLRKNDSTPSDLDDIPPIASYGDDQNNRKWVELEEMYKNQSLFLQSDDGHFFNYDNWYEKYFGDYKDTSFNPDYIKWYFDNYNTADPCSRPHNKFLFLFADDLVKYYGDSKRYDLTVMADNSSYVIFTINGVEYKRSVVDYHASIAVNLAPGIYNITSYSSQFNNSVKNTITVLSTIESRDLVKYYRNASRFEVRLLDSSGNHLNASQKVIFNINGVLYTRVTDNDGVAGLNINLAPEKYVITTNNPVTGENVSNEITVLSLIESGDLVKYYRNDSQFIVRVLNKTSGSVTFNINGVFYTRQINQTGHAKLNINLNPGNYVITTVCGEYVNSNSIIVLSRLCANDLEMSLRDGSQFLLKLLDDNGNRLSGKNVTFNINGVFYNRLTDSNGIAHLNINLGEGNYIITSKYGDMAISNTVRISSRPISDPHQMVNPIVRRAVFNALNDTDIKIVSFDITYDMNHRANLCDLNGNHIGFLTVTEDGKIVQ